MLKIRKFGINNWEKNIAVMKKLRKKGHAFHIQVHPSTSQKINIKETGLNNSGTKAIKRIT